jgi:chromosome segregation ATPase
MMSAHRMILATLALAALAGCDRDDSVQTALADARVRMRAVAPGGGLSRPELRATTFREVAQSLRQVTSDDSATPGQVAAAHLMISSAESGLAGPKAAETTTRLNQVSGVISQIRSIAIERGAATSTATVYASYDPAPEIGEIDNAIRDTQAELEVAREDVGALEEKIASLRQQAAAEVEEARGLRSAEADMRNEALGLDDIGAAGLIADAARIGRQADAHEVAAANVDAEAEMLEPEAAQLELRIEGLVAQAAALNKSRQGVGARAQIRRASAGEASERGKKYEGEVDKLVSELIELSRQVTSTATEAAEAYDRAASSAARAAQHARKSARAASGKARHSAAAMRLALAEHLLDTGSLLSNLGGAQPPLGSARTLAANADRLTTDGLGHLQGALETYRSALSDLESAGADEGLVNALNETISNIEKRLQDAGAGAPGAGEADDMGDDLPIEDPAGDPGEDVGGVGGA